LDRAAPPLSEPNYSNSTVLDVRHATPPRFRPGKQEVIMLSYWPEIPIAVIVASVLIYLYRSEISAFVFRPKKEVDHNEELKNVAEDWKQSGYIDFSVPLELPANLKGRANPHLPYLKVEEYRLVKTVGGGTAIERRWRRGSLADAREVAQNYYQFLREHPEKAFNEDPRKLMKLTRLLENPAA
jgi:hypothetical protein